MAGQWLTAQCGHEAISYLQLYTALNVLIGKKYEALPSLKLKANEARGLFGHDEAANITLLLLSHLTRACKDPRDNIYGLLGLASPSVQAAIHIDYTKSPAECHRDAFLGICKTIIA